MSATPDPAPAAAAVQRAAGFSRYLSRLFAARPRLAEEVTTDLHTPWDRARIDAWLAAEPLTEDNLKPRLRQLRARVFAQAAVRDLAGLATLAEVTQTLSALAEAAVSAVLRTLTLAFEPRFGLPRNKAGEAQQLIVIGMGKLGGRELNVSSDIDLIFVYPEDGDTGGPSSIENFDYFTRLGRRLIDALGDITGDGQVFRVDMRLRPNGDSGPLVSSFAMLEHYFVSQGREWERYAWIKARAMSGERLAELESIARPFIFRKYLDFGAINAMRDLHAQIRSEVRRRDMANHVKLGPGGIREIEFIAQVFQLIRGGRDPALQIKPTLQVLDLLAERGIIETATQKELAAAYDFLRRLEHRLQYLDDAQTHSLPAQPADQGLVAGAMGFANYDALLEELDDHRAAVSRHFEAVFADPTRDGHDLAPVWQGTHDGDAARAALSGLGYRDADAAARQLAALREGQRYQQMAPQIRSRFDALIPQVLEAAGATPDPNATLGRILGLLEAVSRRGAYLALLQQYPQALGKVAQLMGASSWGAEFLTRHPLLLDELLDARLLEAAPDWAEFRQQLGATLDGIEPDMEQQMDAMREAHHAQVFRLLTQDLAGLWTVERLADQLSALADIMLELTLRLTWRKLSKRHREAPRFAVVSYGKLGGKELGYASDLDIVFLYEDDADDALEIYARLAQRVNTWISSRTAAGILFETDLRLRPSGEAGLLVSSVDAFRKYQMESAWVWEHQALTRARFSAGDRDVGRAFDAIRDEVLSKQRDRGELAREVLAMRSRMRDAHAGKSELFDLKHDAGGLVDVEFMVQYLVLGNARQHPQLLGNLGNIALLRIAGEIGLIDPALAAKVGDAYREFRRLQHGLRLNQVANARVEPVDVASMAADVTRLWQQVFGPGEVPSHSD